MFHTSQRLTLPAFLPAITIRSALLFVIALFTIVMAPTIVDRLSGFNIAEPMPLESAVIAPQVSLTHQEPNFYQ